MEFYGPSMAVVKQPMEPVFIEVELEDESPSVELFLENCWVARSPDFNSTPRWNITVDGQVVVNVQWTHQESPNFYLDLLIFPLQ